MKLITYFSYTKQKFIYIIIFCLFNLFFFSNIINLLKLLFTLQFLIQLLKTLIILVPILIAVAFLTLFERKIMAAIQRRRGPNVVGFLGLLQPFADGLKLLIKETILPSRANQIIFIIAPILTIFLSFLG